MGNTHVKKRTNTTDSRRSQLFAVLLQRKSETPAEPEAKKSPVPRYPFMESRPVTRRMAIFGQDYETSKVEKAKSVNVDFIYQIPKSKVIVNPFDGQLDQDYVTIERSIHGKDDEQVFRSVLQEIFTPMQAIRNSRRY